MKSLIVIFVLSNLAILQSLGSTSADLNLPLVEKQNAEYLKKAEKTITDPGQFPSSFHHLYNYQELVSQRS